MKYFFLSLTSALILIVGVPTSVFAASSKNLDSVSIDRGHKPWVFRTNLDDRTRMIVLALRKDFWVSYNTEYSSIYKVWRDGIKFDGMVYNQRSGPHPATLGSSYLLSINHFPWRIRTANKILQPKVKYLGHRIENNTVTLRYALEVMGNRRILVEETPEYVVNDAGVPGLERKIKTLQVPGDVVVELATLSTDEKESPFTMHSLNSNSITVITRYFTDGLNESASQHVEQVVSEGKRLIDNNDCDLCHNASEKGVGPSYVAIAERYTATPEVTLQLLSKVIEGGSGNWGSDAMTPHPDLLHIEGECMIQYILGFNDENKDLLAQKSPSAISVFFARVSGWMDNKYNSFMSLFLDDEEQKPNDIVVIEPQKKAVHPSFDLSSARPESFKPMVGGMDFDDDGLLYVTTWDQEGAVYVVNGLNKDGEQISVKKIANGLAEPLGIKVLGDDIYVMQKQEFTRLRDSNNDGLVDSFDTITNDWPVTTNFHEFAFGLLYKDNSFYASLSTAVKPGGLPESPQLPKRGSVIRIDKDSGAIETIANGLRTPNGLGFGRDNALYVTDNQGSWLPANKLIRIKQNGFYGFRGLENTSDTREEEPPLVYIPHDDIGNSPSQPVVFDIGPYQNQLLYGDVTHGGIKRVSIDRVGDTYQGCVYRFSQGLEAGVNRMIWGPDGALYVGGIGVRGNWKQQDKLNYGLQRLKYNGKSTFEILNARVLKKGIELNFTHPLNSADVSNRNNYKIFSWYYEPSMEYGGPKMGLETLAVRSAKSSKDSASVSLEVDGLKKGRVVYVWSDIRSDKGDSAWSKEAWCTINSLGD